MLSTGSPLIDAERAFTREARARRRAALRCALLRGPARCRTLQVFEDAAVRPVAAARPMVREIPLDAIRGSLEPGRARMFDGAFRPRRAVRVRWQRVWLAEHRGAVLPPIEVAPVPGGYAIRDGHHRVSVARARGGVSIDAVTG